ncbi:translation initiation factor IF-3 [Patescibacteria group bacterium]|nr:translation initiation factor IF-3 [Patescibacteria group bacterium]
MAYYQPQIRINESIRAREVRVIGSKGENLGVMSIQEALKKSKEEGLDLIETSPNAKPPIAKITDYGKFQYDEKKKLKVAKAKAHTTETKIIQTKLNTGEHDLELKAKNISKWLKEGNRIKLDLFLRGREKYMDFNFLKERINRVLQLVTEEYKIADGPKKSPKGLSMILEKK